MDWNGFLIESLTGIWGMAKQMAVIIFPLLIFVEIIDELGILEKISNLFKNILKHLNLPKEASLPLIIGQAFGLLFGAGLILRATADNKFETKELMSIAVFFAICHAVFEDTLLFMAIGGNGFIILGTRLLLAVIITYLYGKYRTYEAKKQYKSKLSA
ncbi:MAG: nucleoside recognition domain-containing protein [bacterium]